MISNVTEGWLHSVATSGRQLEALSDGCIPAEGEILPDWGLIVVSILPMVALVVCAPVLYSKIVVKGLLNRFKYTQGPNSGKYVEILNALPGTFPFRHLQTKYSPGISELVVTWLGERGVSASVKYAFLSPAVANPHGYVERTRAASTEMKHPDVVGGWCFEVKRWLMFGEKASLFHPKEWERVHNTVFQSFSNDQAHVFYPSVKSACLHFVDSVEERVRQRDDVLCCMELGRMILSMAVSSNIQICFGYEGDENVRAVKRELEKIFSENVEMWISRALQVVPWCSWIPFSRSRDLANAMSVLREVTLDVVTHRLCMNGWPHSRNPQEIESSVPAWDGLSHQADMPPRRSLFGVYCDSWWHEKGHPPRNAEVCDDLLTFMMAHLSRTARALSCMVHELAQSTRMQNALHAEIDRAMTENRWCGPGDGLQWLEWETVDRCPYLACIVKAFFELCPSIAGFGPREFNEDIVVEDVLPPKSTEIHFDSKATHRCSANLTHGKSVLTRRLEDYTDNLMARKAEPHAHSTFFSVDGKTRPCVGRYLYLMEIKTGLFTTFRKFDAESCDSSHHEWTNGACRVRWKPRW